MIDQKYKFGCFGRAKGSFAYLNQRYGSRVSEKLDQFNRLSLPGQQKFVKHVKTNSRVIVAGRDRHTVEFFVFQLKNVRMRLVLIIDESRKSISCVRVEALEKMAA